MDPNLAANMEKIEGAAAQVTGRPIRQMDGAQLDQTAANEVRAQQMGLAQFLGQTATGSGPSAAGAVLQAGSDQSMADAMALARSSRGNQGIALKQALAAQGKIGQQTANAATQLKAQEQLQAQQTLAGFLGQTRGQDLAAAGTNAQLSQQTQATNLQSAVQQQQFMDDQQKAYLAMGLTLEQAQLQAMRDYETLRMQNATQRYGIQQGVSVQQSGQAAQTAGSVLGALATIGGGIAMGAMSDERVKKNVKPADAKMTDFLEHIGAHDYEYKDPDKPFRGRGRFVSPMAQELEKSELGRSMVKDTPDGKIVDYGKGFGTLLAAIAHQHKRIAKIEGGKRGNA
jgi:hypothetical protein